MASGGEVISSYYSNSAIKFAWQIQSQSVSNNSTTVYYQLRGIRTTSGYVQAGNFAISIDGTVYWSDATRIAMYDDTLITEGTFTITHDPTGARSFAIYIEAGIYTIAVSVSGSQTFSLNTIPRYTSITSFSVSKRDETSVTYKFTTSNTCDWAWYSKDNGSTWSNLPANNIVTGLTANTTYNFKLRVRRADSQLTTDSSTVSQTTYDYPKISAVQSNPLIIGNSQKLTLYNPLSRSVTVKMYQNSTSGTQLYSGTTSGTSITFTPTASTLYSTIPNAQSSACVYSVIYSNNTKTVTGYTYKVIGTETPTFSDFAYEDSNAVTTTFTGNNQVLIKGKSTLKVTISAANKMTAKNSATEKSYGVTCDNKTGNANYSSTNPVDITLGTIDNVGTKRIDVTAYDSRNLNTTVSKDVAVYDYAKPVVNVSATRLNNFENQTTLTINGSFSSIVIDNIEKNSIQSVQYRYREAERNLELLYSLYS